MRCMRLVAPPGLGAGRPPGPGLPRPYGRGPLGEKCLLSGDCPRGAGAGAGAEFIIV